MTDTANPGAANGAGQFNDGTSGPDTDRLPEEPGNALFDGLSDDNRRVAEAKGWVSADGIVESYRNLESKLGDSLRLPADDAAPEDWQVFYGRLGRPDAPEGYEFAMPEGLSEDFPYDAESASRFARWAHDAGLTPRQAQALHDRFVHDMNGQFSASGEERMAAVDRAHEALVEAWGAPTSERYQRSVELANRALRELGGNELAQALMMRGALSEDGAITDPAIGFMLKKAGERLFAEDQVFSAQGRTANPFLRDAENITEQGRLLRNDPDLARTFIRAANREHDYPRLFGSEF